MWTLKSDAGASIRRIAFAPSDATRQTYAIARYDGQILLTQDDGAHWSLLNSGGSLPQRKITSLAFGPFSAFRLWVTLAGFDAVTPNTPGHVFRTDDALSAAPTWTDVSPPVDLPHWVVATHPSSADAAILRIRGI
jgi:hypothetical protein